MSINLEKVRKHFPSLKRDAIFFDNPGGTQIAKPSLTRIQKYLLECNANHGGVFQTSIESDAVLDEAHQAMADFLNAKSKNEIIFGANMTTLTFALSRAIVKTFNPGDEIVVTRMDHDANISPWVLAAEDHGIKVNWIDFDVEDFTLKMDEIERVLTRKPRLIAFGYASNATGTVNPARKIIQMAKAAGTLTYLDAVQYAPHGPIDVQDLECDFLACSAYKFFGPHVGAVYGRYELLDELKPYKVRPATNETPGKFETGTQNHEGIAGVLGALEYLEWFGEKFGGEFEEGLEGYTGRALSLKKGMTAMRAYEMELSRALIETIQQIKGARIFGITDMKRLDERVPTVSFRIDGIHPLAIAEALAKKNIYVWNGNYYALAVTERLGIEESGGMVRVGAAHYNTFEEIEKLGKVLKKIG